MFKIGDRIKIIGNNKEGYYTRKGSFEIVDVTTDSVIIKSLRKEIKINFKISNDIIKLDESYYRKLKIDKICSKLVI